MTIVECPVCAQVGWYQDMNVHLFDSHDWPALRIAHWAEKIELSETEPEPGRRTLAEEFRARYFEGQEPKAKMALLVEAVTNEIAQALKSPKK